jgi:hypothetical protein
MNLKDQGFRFCLSPDAKRARWCHPVEIPHFYADWVDVTDWPDAEFEKFLMDRLPKEDSSDAQA